MKKHLSIRAKLLLGMGILIVGYAASTAIGYFSGVERERELAAVGAVNVPLSLKSQSALFAFEASSKAFADAVMTGDADTLNGADERNAALVASLEAIDRLAGGGGLGGVSVSRLRSQAASMPSLRREVFAGMSGDSAAREATRSKATALNDLTELLRREITSLSEASAGALDETLARSIAATRWQRQANLAIALVIVIVGAAVVFWIVQHSIVGPMRRIAEGLHISAGRVEKASDTIGEAGRILADGANSQAASLEETSAALEEISSVAKRNADHSALAKSKVSLARSTADEGASDIATMRTAMGDVQSASANIAKIVKAIDEIAFQTNILALNAAVEAARAGESGAGFAVVAEEVRNLASRSAQAARETASLIEDSIAKSSRGTQISDKVAVALEQIGRQIYEIDELVADIAQSSKEQSSGVSAVNSNILKLNDTTQTNAASAEESAATVEELAAQVRALNGFTETLNLAVYGSAESARGSVAPVSCLRLLEREPAGGLRPS